MKFQNPGIKADLLHIINRYQDHYVRYCLDGDLNRAFILGDWILILQHYFITYSDN